MMANTYKNLGQSLPSGGALTDLYTVPSATSCIVSSLVICNQGSTSAKFRVSHAVAGAADAAAQYLAWDIPVDPGTSYVFTLGLTLAAADKLRVQSSNGQTSFNLYGQEVT